MVDYTERPAYDSMPPHVRAWVERELGSTVTSAMTQASGFSPGVAARLTTASGAQAFIKAIATSRHAATAELHRYETRAMQAIPPTRLLPRLYSTLDDGDWVALLLEDIDGRHPDGWSGDDIRLVGPAVEELSTAFTPSPWKGAQRLDQAQRVRTSWWTQVDADDAPAWIREHLPELIALHERIAVQGQTLCLRDLRADNVLITDSGRVVFIDWAWASLGAEWTDTMHLVCDIVGIGASVRDAETLLTSSVHTRHVDPVCLTAYLANLAGSAYVKARRDDSQNIAELQAWRRSRADSLLSWLRHRAGW